MIPPFDWLTYGGWRIPSSPDLVAEALQVAAHERTEIGVDHRGGEPLVLAKLRRHVGRQRDEQPGEPRADLGLDEPLVRGIHIAASQ